MLLILPLASNSVMANSNDVELVITFGEPNSDGDWFIENESLSISIEILNNAQNTRSIEYNPSCPVEIEMFDNNGELFTNLREHRACQQQNRAIDIPSGQTRLLDNFVWDWKNSTNEIINGGLVTINFNFKNGEATNTKIIEFQHEPISISGLAIEVNTAKAPGERNHFYIGEPIFSHVSLRNIGESSLILDFDDECKLTIEETTDGLLSKPVMTNLGCGSGSSLGIGESLPLGWFEWNYTKYDENILFQEWDLNFGFTGISDLYTTSRISFSFNNDEPIFTTPIDVSVNIDNEGNNDVITGEDLIQINTNLENNLDSPIDLELNNSCLVYIHLISEKGSIVSDTRDLIDCEEQRTEIKLSPGDSYELNQHSWEMTDNLGCELNDGNYVLIVNIPQFNHYDSYNFIYDGYDNGNECRASLQDATMTELTIIEKTTNYPNTLNESVTFSLQLENQNELQVYWPQECKLEFAIQKIGSSEPHRIWLEECVGEGGIMSILSPGSKITYNPFTIEFANLNAGTWSFTAKTTGTPSFSAQWAHTWNPPPPVQEESNVEETNEVVENDENDDLLQITNWMAEGSWKYVTTESGGCWILSDLDGVEHAFTNSKVENWKPRTNYRGAYWAEQSFDSSPACISWESRITISEVMGEIYVEPVADNVDEENDLSEGAPVISIPSSGPAIVTLIASTSILALIAGSIINVEWIRLPATKYGLLLIGLVRKNNERGGEYQRGRIVAYIELHRGIHFRALLEALDMSNGQLAHHLSVLEADEIIWRRKDGRKVRYYPSSIDSHTPDDDLPVPVLTPDPNSLQGRILQILDIHENEILNLSQKELSDKLETSQQLVSYHLKSLENWGLVEKERVALRYRYRLTDRALILLNATELPTYGDDH